ncbi:response regulator [Oceanimonas marisflavi]|uniref:response regulator n=1 Tax=Oceanimonas marisflavi TaxID=2059724 RepID=UPI000D3210A5|nr:response regulator [Oceanimonas marisflavi]
MSFRLKTILGVALIEGCLLLIMVWSSISYLRDASQQETTLRAETTSALFVELVRDAVLSSDLARLESLATQALQAPDMAYVRIMDSERVLVEAGAEAETGHAHPPEFHTGADIMMEGQRYGRVELGIHTDRADDFIAGARHYLLSLAAIEMGLVALFSFVLGAYLTRGLGRLARAAEVIGQGKDPEPIAIRGNDELAVTGRAFNTMAERLALSRRDMNEQLHIEQEARRHAAISTALVEANMDAVVIIDLDDTIVEFSSMAEKLFGYTRAQAIGHSMAELLIPPGVREHHHRGMRHYRDTGHGPILGKHIELEAMRADGSLFPAELTVQTIKLDGSVLFAGFMRDISDRKAAEQELKDARVRAEAASLAKSRFLAHMSHEIRSPLNAVLGSVSLLLEDNLTREQRLYAQTAESSGKALLGLINNILDFSRIEAGQLQLDNQRFRLHDLLSDIAAHITLTARTKRLQTALVADAGVPAVLVGDASRLRQVLINLLDNAIKFTDEGAVTLRIEAGPSAAEQVELRFTVQDSGAGIPPDEQHSLFEEFQQADNSDSTRHGGSGLGLSISRGLCRAMGGDLVLAGSGAGGTSFMASLPFGNPQPAAQPPVVSQTSRLLCAGLHPLVLSAMQLACRPAGVRVQAWQPGAATGHEAPPALLLYSGLPAAGRQALLQNIEQQGIEHIIELGHDNGHNGTDALNQRITAKLTLPLLAAPLLQRLQRHLTGRQEPLPSSAREPHAGVRPHARPHRLLLAEDSPANQLVARAMLERAGFEVDIAENGHEALSACSKQTYDLILMDLRMPQMDGLEATRRLRTQQSTARVPILALTANVSQQDVDRCLAAGMDDFIPKPINGEQLLATLARHLPATGQPAEAAAPAPKQPSAEEHQNALPLLDHAVVDTLHQAMGAERFPATMQLFIDENQQRLTRLQQAIDQQQFESATLQAHTIKGCAGTFGAPRLQEWAKDMEAACRRQDKAQMAQLAAGVDALYRQTEWHFNNKIKALTGDQDDSKSTQGAPPAGSHTAG